MIKTVINVMVAMIVAAVPASVVSATTADRATVSAGTYSLDWDTRARQAISRFEALDNGNAGPFAYAYMASAVGRTYGWNDTRVDKYLAKTRSYKQSDGGYGLNYPYDAMGDGTVNPADTTYTVSLTDHVGPVMLEAYQNGKATRDEVAAIGNLAAKIPLVSSNGNGYCVAYSDAPADRSKYTYCIHNVNASVSLFATELEKAGINVYDKDWLTMMIDRRETSAYLPSKANWLYWDNDTTRLSDIDHASLDTEWALSRSPRIGSIMLGKIMNNSFPNEPNDSPLAHWRLTPWACDLGTKWFGEFDAWLVDPPGTQNDLIRYAQMSRWAARNSDSC